MLFSVIFAQNTPAGTTTVKVGPSFSDTFDPATVSISVNDSVIWDWQNTFHSSTSGAPGSPDGLWDSGVYTGSLPHYFTNKFTSAGSYPYFCSYHYFYGMVGEVDVSGAVAPNPPTLAINTPKGGAVFAAPANVTIQAGVTNGSGLVTNVQFLVNNNVLTNETSGPYSAVTNNLSAGGYTLSAIAIDNNGLSATNSVGISVVTPLTVSLTSGSHPTTSDFQFNYSADIGLSYVVQRTTDFITWTPLLTNKAASNPVLFDDPNATNGSGYYRVGSLPTT